MLSPSGGGLRGCQYRHLLAVCRWGVDPHGLLMPSGVGELLPVAYLLTDRPASLLPCLPPGLPPFLLPARSPRLGPLLPSLPLGWWHCFQIGASVPRRKEANQRQVECLSAGESAGMGGREGEREEGNKRRRNAWMNVMCGATEVRRADTEGEQEGQGWRKEEGKGEKESGQLPQE